MESHIQCGIRGSVRAAEGKAECVVHDGIPLTICIWEGGSPNCNGLCACPTSISSTFIVDAAAFVLLAEGHLPRRPIWTTLLALDPVYFQYGGEAASLLLSCLVAGL